METYLFDFHRVISKEVVYGVVVLSSLKSIVVPHGLERKDFSVIVQILLEAVVGVSSSQLDLDVLLVFLGIGRVYLGVFSAGEGGKEVSRQDFRVIEGDFHILEKLFGEGVAVIDAEDAFEDVQVNRDVDIFPSVVVVEFSDDLGHFLPFEEYSLRNTSIFNFLLSDEHCLVGEIVVN